MAVRTHFAVMMAVLALSLSACASSPAAPGALPSTIENAFGNTLVATMPNGRVARYYFEPDGAYAVDTGAGTLTRGRYEVEGDQICRTPNGGERACAAFATDKRVGDRWRQSTADGLDYEVRLERGRPERLGEGHD
jgi:hypothetical protein